LLIYEKNLSIVLDATHLFEELGTPEEVAEQVVSRFQEYLQEVK
jgi:hypothetical protein